MFICFVFTACALSSYAFESRSTRFEKALLEHIDSDQLAKEYGGTCKLCTNSPKCVPTYTDEETKADIGELANTQSLSTETIPAGKKFELKIPCKQGFSYAWYFKTQVHDIGFSAKFQPGEFKDSSSSSSSSNSSSDSGCSGDEFSVCNYARVRTEKIPIQGHYDCSKNGVLILTWDNSYSWTTPKVLHYTFAEIASGVEDSQK
jgi:hypothetical protein